ncbi:MAG: imelysin family protein [Bermanella sp.]
MPIKKNQLSVLLATVLTFGMSGCGSDTDSTITTSLSEVDLAIQHSINFTAIDAIDDFSQNIETLYNDVEAFCTTTNTDTLSAAQSSWTNSYIAWYKVLPFQFGPLANTDNSSPILDYIDAYRNATDSNRSTNLAAINPLITTLMASGDAITQTSFSNTRAKEVGLSVLETALFSTTSNSTNPADIVSEFNAQSKKCNIIDALSYELTRRTSFVHAQWKNDYRDTALSYQYLFTNNLLENYFSVIDVQGDGTGTPASEELVVSMQEFLDFTGNANLFTDLTRYSTTTIWMALEESIITIENILDQTPETELTLLAIINNNGYEQDVETIKLNIATIKQAITEQNTTDFVAAVQALDGNFKTSVLDGLNINKGLTFADGDS